MNKKLLAKRAGVLLLDFVLAAAIVGGTYYYNYMIPQEMESLDITVAVPQSDSQAEGETESTDWKDKFAEHFTEEIVTADTGYSSPNVSVQVERRFFGEGQDTVTYYVADIYISSIDCFKTQFGKDTYGYGFHESIDDITARVNEILAINGDSYSNKELLDSGTIIRNGTVYRMENTPYDVLALYYDGTMKVYENGNFDAEQAVKDGVYQTWIFGPSLLDGNGTAKTDGYNTWDYIDKTHPRTAIGYYEPGHYCMLVADGRQEKENYSRGMTLSEMARTFEELGCSIGYNLDGGHVSFMTLNGQLASQPYRSQTTDIKDIIYICEPGN